MASAHAVTAVMLVAMTAAATATLLEGEFELVAHLRHRNREEFERLFWAIATPGNPKYLQHLSLMEVASILGASEMDIDAVSGWLLGLGANPSSVRVSAMRDTVAATFSSSSPAASMTLASWPTASVHRPLAVEFLVRHDGRTAHRPTSIDHVRQPARNQIRDDEYDIATIKRAYGMPTDLQATNTTTLQMVWGPGTFGYSASQLRLHKLMQCPLLDLAKVKFDTDNHGEAQGDNFEEGNLDVKMIASFGLNVKTLVSNTNTSASTEEGEGFGQALLSFVTELASRETLPHVLSMSLGSLSARSCELLCSEVAKTGQHSGQECRNYLQRQRQVCMFISSAQVSRISTAFQVLGVRGVSVFGSSGDGGSHFSFDKFEGGSIAHSLNMVSCKFQMPVFPTSSPYILSVGGSMWSDSPSDPVTWEGFGGGSGGGFSLEFDAPHYQATPVTSYLNATHGLPPASSFKKDGRAYPDISAVAVMGTSQSCPIMAGMFAMIIDHRLNAGLPALGFLGPRVWQVAQQFNGEAFQDITKGNSKTFCDNGFPSSRGWDPDTGWGRPIWPGMLKHFGSDMHVAQSPMGAVVV